MHYVKILKRSRKKKKKEKTLVAAAQIAGVVFVYIPHTNRSHLFSFHMSLNHSVLLSIKKKKKVIWSGPQTRGAITRREKRAGGRGCMSHAPRASFLHFNGRRYALGVVLHVHTPLYIREEEKKNG